MMTDESNKEKIYGMFKRIIERTDTSFDSRTMEPDDFFHDMEEMKNLVTFMQDIAEASPHLMLLKDMSFNRVLSGLIGGLIFWDPSDSNSEDGNMISEYARKELDRCVELKIPPRRYWCFLYNFDMEQEIHVISKTMRIRKATLFEKTYFVSRDLDQGWKGTHDNILEIIPNPSYPRIKSESEKIERMMRDEPITEIEYLLTSLRLLNPSSVGVNWIISCNRYESFTISGGYNIRSDLYPATFSRRWRQRCIFDAVDWKRVSQILDRIKEIAVSEHEEVPRLLRVLRRYNRAICSEFIEDEVIDLWIILETISKKTGRDAASFISEIIAITTKDQQAVKKKLDNIYLNIRNPIFHGGTFDSENLPYVDFLFSVTSNALRVYLVLMDVHGGFSEYIKSMKSDLDEREKLDDILKIWLDFNYIQS